MSSPPSGHDYSFLESVLPADRISVEHSQRTQFSVDASPHEPTEPDAVAWPETTDEVAAVLSAANDRGVPVTPWSGGSSLEGNPIPVAGGIVLDTSRMTDLSVRPDDLQAVVGPGVVYDDLNESLARHGLRFPPGISSGDVATVGGMIANNASGFNAIRYGETRDHVLGLEVALPDGRVVNVGRGVFKTSAGYSLKDLFVGSEGTLGVITEATLSLSGIPQRRHAARVTFESRRHASEAVADVIRAGLVPGALEFVDARSLELINAYYDESVFRIEPTLIVELHANNSGIEEDVAFLRTICEENGATGWDDATGSDRSEMWRARRDALPAYKAAAGELEPGMIGDIVVPISTYPEIVTLVAEVATELDIPTPCVGHAGDGNLHYVPLVDPSDDAAIERAGTLNDRVVSAALELGGTATGEHGVGVGKRKFMRTEHGGGVDLMRVVKDGFDPNGIMNPGKILPEEP